MAVDRHARKRNRYEKLEFLAKLEEAQRPRESRRVDGIKAEALAAYGDRCVTCGCQDQSELELDHVRTTGKAHRLVISKGRSGADFYLALKKLGFPNKEPYELETVCKRCHGYRTAKRRFETKEG